MAAGTRQPTAAAWAGIALAAEILREAAAVGAADPLEVAGILGAEVPEPVAHEVLRAWVVVDAVAAVAADAVVEVAAADAVEEAVVADSGTY